MSESPRSERVDQLVKAMIREVLSQIKTCTERVAKARNRSELIEAIRPIVNDPEKVLNDYGITEGVKKACKKFGIPCDI